MPTVSRRRTAWLLLSLPLLLQLPTASTARPDAYAGCGCPLSPARGIGAPAAEGTDSLALHPGAHLAAPKVRPLRAPTAALQQAVQSLPSHARRSPSSRPAAGRPTHAPATGTDHGHASPGTSTPSAPPATSAFTPPSATAATSPAPNPRDDHSPTAQPEASRPWAFRFAGVLALVAAFLTGVLTLRRRQRTRQHETAGPEATSPLSDSRREVLQRLDEALRTMAHHQADRHSGPLPALSAARITPHAIHLLPRPTGRPLPPPATAGTGGWWELPHDADLPAAPAALFPCPTLVTLGTSPTGDLLLLDLTEPGALLLKGSPDDVARVCTALLLEYALAPWAGDLHLVATGFADDLLHAPLADNIVHAPTPAAAVHALAERLLEAHQQPHTRPRACMLLTATALDAATARDLARLAAHPAPLPVIAVAPAPGVQDHFPDAVILDASTPHPQPLHTTSLDLTLQRIDESAHQDLTALLTDSADAGPPAPARAHADTDEPPVQAHSPHTEEPAPSPTAPTPPAPTGTEGDHVFPALTTALAHTTAPDRTDSTGPRNNPAGSDRAHRAAPTARPTTPAAPCGPLSAAHPSAASSTPRAPQIRVLGPIEVDGVPHTGHGPRTAQLAALLYFRPGRTADTLCADMDPTTPWTTATLSARLHQLRRALGNTPDGDPYVPRRQHADDPYRLHPAIRCDWTEFRTLTDHALDQGADGLNALEAALGLVRGRPFGSRPLPWTEPHSQELTTRIIHTADVIARLRTPPGPHHDLTKARHAITTALDIDDTAESLYRAWFLIEAQADNRPGLHTAITRLQYINAALDRPLSPETEHLIDELLHPQSPPAARP
ncbi:hypothetical protein [Streptomyces sp. NPDC096032]|uniref:hypothetical protein n=1 Tax=Streptomyces sp. NPDC096032 TaxID=3366070 RepID=UPI00382B1CA8